MIRGIFFDAHGVLYDREESTGRYAVRLLAERGFAAEIPAAEGGRLRALNNQASTGVISAEAYWDEFLRTCGVTDAGDRAALMQEILAQAHHVVSIPGAGSTLAALKRRGFILGIITDTMYPLEWKTAWLAKVEVAGFLDVVVSSTAVRSRKPDPEIYLHALAQTGLRPVEAAFVGHDDRELDGARRVGMVTVAVNHEPEAKADYYVRLLPDLLTLPIFQSDGS